MSAPCFAHRRPDWQLPSLDLHNLQLDSFEPLQRASKRQACPQCGRSRALYCYDCLVAFTRRPSIQLPFKVHIITHPAEPLAKATGVQAAVLCPGQVVLQSLESLAPLEASSCAVMFPSEDALLPSELELAELKHVIVIDSKWRKARELNGHPMLAGMKRVKLPGTPRSTFWRFHTQGTADEGVCTVEALHLLMQALADKLPQSAGHWDNLLWYYAYQHKLIEKAAAERATKRLAQGCGQGYAPEKFKKQRCSFHQQQQPQEQPQEQEQQQQQQQQPQEHPE